MKKIISIFSSMLLALLFVSSVSAKGFDTAGYNEKANLFNGTGWSWCMDKVGDNTWCNSYLGDYKNDKLTMKWNEQWDICNEKADDTAESCLGAWTTNHWQGMKGDGTNANWFYKMIWVGPEGEDSPYWVEGGYSIWGSYETILDMGKDPFYGEGHIVLAKGIPNGLK